MDVSLRAFKPGATASVAATSSSDRAALNAKFREVEITNAGNVTAFVALGDSSVTATTSGYPILAGQTKVVRRMPTDTHAAAITASGSATIYFTSGSGS